MSTSYDASYVNADSQHSVDVHWEPSQGRLLSLSGNAHVTAQGGLGEFTVGLDLGEARALAHSLLAAAAFVEARTKP